MGVMFLNVPVSEFLIFKSLVLPTATYANETEAISKREDAFQHRFKK